MNIKLVFIPAFAIDSGGDTISYKLYYCLDETFVNCSGLSVVASLMNRSGLNKDSIRHAEQLLPAQNELIAAAKDNLSLSQNEYSGLLEIGIILLLSLLATFVVKDRKTLLI